jgi:hypothetical protein
MTPEEEDDAQKALMSYLQGQPPIMLEIEVQTALLVIGNLQLALRHPQNAGDGARAIRAFARELQERIAPVGSPIHDIMEEGWEMT